MGFSSGVSIGLDQDPGVWSLAAAINRAKCLDAARKEFIRQRSDELIESDDPQDYSMLAEHVIQMHRTAFGVAFRKIIAEGTVGSMLEMDDLLRKAADTIAQEEWHRGQS